MQKCMLRSFACWLGQYKVRLYKVNKVLRFAVLSLFELVVV
jgi:hypothetical protein